MVAPRLKSIDVFRALTMFFMIFVNDLWTLKNVPQWLEHAAAGEDAMGFSDVIFPAFLFIVGLSTPYALNNRLSRNESQRAIFYHIVVRSLALVIMGFFHVNLENYSQVALLPKPLWQVLITVCFFLIWLDYPRTMQPQRKTIFQTTGMIVLLFLAAVYAGKSGETGIIWMRTSWWGILGLIGWAYFFCASIYLFAGKKPGILTLSLILFFLLNSWSHLHWQGLPLSVQGIIRKINLGDTANLVLVMGGITTGALYHRFSFNRQRFTFIIILASILLIAFGLVTRPIWGISKIGGTPSWVAICLGICLVSFITLIFLVDQQNKEHWFRLIKAAGISTLTCYLLPYIHYALLAAWPHLQLPEWLRTGGIGITKSLSYALIIILITEGLSKLGIRLKI